LIAAKVAPALAAGCTVVLKPSEVAPPTAYLLAEVIHEAGLPAGVFNRLPGFGPVVGEALASHPEVDMVSFTGSTGAGRRVGKLGAQTIKRVALELGGKSARSASTTPAFPARSPGQSRPAISTTARPALGRAAPPRAGLYPQGP